MTHTPKLQFADPREQEDLPIEILVGGDNYWKIVKDSPPLRISPSVVLLQSNLGWILSGNRSDISANVAAVNFLHLQSPGPLPETEIKRFWDLETIGITSHQDKGWNTKDSAVLQTFHDSFKTKDSRRVVSLPRKDSSNQPTKRGEQVQVAGNKAKKECEPASRVLHPHAGLHATWTSRGCRFREETGGNVLLSSPCGVQKQTRRHKMANRV